MPTAARLFAAVFFAFMGYMVAGSVEPLLPEGMRANWLKRVPTIVGIFAGWRVMGRLVGNTYAVSINSGTYCVAVILFFSLATFAISEMLKQATRLQYDGPMDAIVNSFGIAFEQAQLLLHPSPIGLMIFAAVVGGLGAEFCHRRWR